MNKDCCYKTWCQIYDSLKQIRNYRFLICIICAISLFSHNDLYSQKFLTDTIYIDFKGDSILSAEQVCIKDIIDNRDEIPNFVMYRAKKKFLILPVDQEILTIKPVSEAIMNGFKTNDNCNLSYTIHINKFEIEKRQGRFSSSTFLVADIPVYEHKDDSSHYLGTLYYDHRYHPLHKKEIFPESAQNLLYNWHIAFKTDLIRINALQDNSNEELPPNLIIAPNDKPLYLQIRTGAFAGRNWYGLQGEIFFTRPEISNRYKTTSGIVRYQNNSDYESLSIGRNSEHFTFRKNDNFSLDIDLNILLGFLKWKDVKVHNPTLYQIINVEVSSIQSIILDRKNKQGFTFRVGTIESLTYIYNKKLKFHVGGFLGFGYKF